MENDNPIDQIKISDYYDLDIEQITEEDLKKICKYHRDNAERFAIQESSKTRKKKGQSEDPGKVTFDDV